VSNTQELSLNGLVSMRPNPANDYIELAMPSRLYQQGYTYQISDQLGRVVGTGEIDRPSYQISVSHLELGLFNIVLLKANAVLYQSSFIKE